MWIGMALFPTRATRRLSSVSGQAGDPLGTARAKRFRNMYFYYHIRVLLVKTNPMIYICCIKYQGMTCVLTVRDDDDEDASLSARLPREARSVLFWRTTVITWMSVRFGRASSMRASRRAGSVCSGSAGDSLGTARAKRFRDTYFYYHIHVLLVKTNPMIYICCIKYQGMTCVLTVRSETIR